VTSRYLQDDVLRPLREETTKDDSSRVALLYGPVVLAGRLAEVTHPFSDPVALHFYADGRLVYIITASYTLN